MAEETNQPTQSETAPKTQEADDKSRASAPVSSGRGWAILAVVLSLAAICAAGYLFYRLEFHIGPQVDSQIQQIDSKLEHADAYGEQIESLRQRNLELSEQIQELTSNSNKLGSTLRASDKETDRQIKDVIDSISSIYQNLDRKTEDWRLEEIAYLLVIGNQRLQIANDIDTALLIWPVVDQHLERQIDPRLLVVRQMVNEEVILLRQVQPVDITEMSIRLLGLANTVDSLPFKTVMAVPEPQDEETAPTAESHANEVDTGVNRVLSEIWVDLKSLVRVQKIQDSVPPVFRPEQQYYLRENVKLTLMGVNISLIQGEDELYQANLEYVQQSLDNYFSPTAQSVRNFASDIEMLAKMPVATEIPDVSGSLKLLQRILDEKIDG